MRTTAFFGNIGCGKSTWLRELEKRGYTIAAEDLSQVIFLQDYWKEQRNPLQTQIGFYATWLALYNKVMGLGGGLIDSSILSHHCIFTQCMFDNGNLSAREFQLCEQLFQAINDIVKLNHIFLYCRLDENIRRVEVRARKNEIRDANIIADVYHRLNSLYESRKQTISFIDVTNLSPQSKHDVDLLITRIEGIES